MVAGRCGWSVCVLGMTVDLNGGLIMNKDDRNVGAEVILLLTRQRNLYHQLNVLTEKQSQLTGTNSPELLLKIISGRRKLIVGLRQVNEKLRLIKSSWPTISMQIGVEHKTQARRIAGDAQKILERILKTSPPEVIDNLETSDAEQLDGLFVE